FEYNAVDFVTGRITTNCAGSNIPVLESTNQVSHWTSAKRPSSALLPSDRRNAFPTHQ
ncbi:hypothetical protein BGY98DRAFT_1187240, partial [Russula aff. rugulosa BPL654]